MFGGSAMLGILTFVVVIGFGLVLMQPVFAQYVDTYAVRVRPRKAKAVEVTTEQPHNDTILLFLRTIGDLVLTLMPGLADKRTVQLLMEANYRTPAHLGIYIGLKSIVVGVFVFFGLIANVGNVFGILLCVPAALLGWLFPNFFLAGRVKARQNLILSELPTMIDLLIVCAQAGLGLLMAVDKVSKECGESCPILSIELQQLINDVKVFAKSVPIAMREMGERCGVDDLIAMASSLIAAEAKGADISYPLRQQGDALRERLKRKKEEEAAKVPVKMVPVIMIFVMPLILAPMLGPAVVTIFNAIGPLMNGK
jgi:tight adherence protein C